MELRDQTQLKTGSYFFADPKQRGCGEEALEIRDLLLSWAFKAGKYQTGRGILERACYGLACLSIIFELADSVLLDAIREWVVKEDGPPLELRIRAAEEIRNNAEEYRHRRYEFRAIEAAMAQVDQDSLRTLLLGLADQLVLEEITEQE